jgi:hypothetical protein
MQFHVTLENPKAGQLVYVALYDIDGRFCGTASKVCEDEDINLTGTKANFLLTCNYEYWNYETIYNYDENGSFLGLNPQDKWLRADGLPFTAKTFTWDNASGMHNLSSVDQKAITYDYDTIEK